MDIDRFDEILGEVLDEIPDIYFRDLNGGVQIQEEIKYHEASQNNDLYIMGEYHVDILGRYVVIYYGSFMATYGHCSEDFIKARLRETVRHELTHHWEIQAGEHDLEVEDAITIRRYLDSKKH